MSMVFINKTDIWRIMQSVHNRKVILYGTGVYANDVVQKLRCLDIDVAYCVDDDLSNVQVSIEVKDVYSLMFEKEDFYVFIAKKDRKRCAQILNEIGLEFYRDFNSIINAKAMQQFVNESLLDVNLGYTMPFQGTDGQGIKIFGDINKAKYIIAILGGSTSDASIYPWKSWGEYLWEYDKDDWAIVVGAVAGYSSSEEVIKLIRDIIPLKPDLIISYSGVNDPNYRYPYVNGYQSFLFNKLKLLRLKDAYGNHSKMGDKICYGIQNGMTYAERWVHNQRIMHSIAEEFGIQYKAFFQPALYTKCRREKDEMMLDYMDDRGFNRTEYVQQVKKQIKEQELDFIVDATDWLDAYDGLFYDWFHVENLGNKYIAEKMYQYLFKARETR